MTSRSEPTSTTAKPSTVDLDDQPGLGPPTSAGLRRRLLASNTFRIALVLLGLCLLFGIVAPGFLSTKNILYTLIETSVLLILSVGMTFVIITGGIDLSVGSVLIFGSMTAGLTMNQMSPGGDSGGAGWGVIMAGLLVAVVSGAAWGLLNGLLIARAKIPPLVVTLGSFGAALGAANLLNNGSDIQTAPTLLNDTLGKGVSFFVVPNMVLIAVVITALGAWLLHTTQFGRYTYAIGSSPEAARRAGIGVTRHLTFVYLVAGTLAGLAGFLSLAYFSTTNISGHTTDNLDAIAAVVIGGSSLFGGIGSMFGTVIGVFIPAVLKKGFVVAGLPDFWQRIAVAAVLVVVVWFDQERRRARDRS